MREAHRFSDIDESLRLSRSEEIQDGEELGALEAIDLEVLLGLYRRPCPAAAAAAAGAAFLRLLGRGGFLLRSAVPDRRGSKIKSA